ncbi:MAG: aminotransferase class V-fold PLP-dependent enzyme [Polyangiaceae bacterium]
MSKRIYLDFNATTPPLDDVIDAQRDAAKSAWGNPSSIHEDGRRARSIVEDARAQVALLAECDARDVIFTSGGTEANNLALRSAFTKAPRLLITSVLEHPSVVRVAEALEREGKATVRWADVAPNGAVDVGSVERILAAENAGTVVIAIQAVNHETGIFQPIAEILQLAAKCNAWLHVDAVQAFGRRADVVSHATTRSISAHKIRGPKGIGALMTLPDMKIEPVLRGGAQERGIRPGTIDPVAAAGFAVAAAHAKKTATAYEAKAPLRDALEAALVSFGGIVNGGGAGVTRAPHVTNVSFPKWVGAEMVAALDLEGVSVSSGSACSADTIEPSPVVSAIAGEARAKSAVRISLGTTTTETEITRAIEVFRLVTSRI